VDQHKVFIQHVWVEPRKGCTKWQNPSEGCRLCPLLLPLSFPDGSFDLTRLPSPECISAMIVRPGLVGINAHFFSGICARKGCLSTAMGKEVPGKIV
jgi:hypothetical protein